MMIERELDHSLQAKGHLLWGKTDRNWRSCIEGMDFARNERSPSMGKRTRIPASIIGNHLHQWGKVTFYGASDP